jgi:tetratricopeptide (TPR) repeat protein
MRGRRALVVAVVLVGVVWSRVASACMWDHDTLRQERARFPSTLELITGKFLRHSPEFYAWRRDDRRARLAQVPGQLALEDDLAVALFKTGDPAGAIATLEAVERRQPGRYQTAANLGTFLVLDGKLAEGLVWIDRALAIDPQAHFGRERTQKWLVEYVLLRQQARPGRPLLPLRAGEGEGDPATFDAFVLAQPTGSTLDAEIPRAITGVLGMMRFADHRNPLLLEALGDLLLADRRSDAKQLAARAYLAAAASAPEAAAAYRSLAAQALRLQTVGDTQATQLPLADLERQLAEENADAARWYDELRTRELGWIREGGDVDARFDALYTAEPTLDPPVARSRLWPWLLAGAAAVIAALFVHRRVRLRRLAR